MLAAALLAVLLALYLVFEGLGISIMADPLEWVGEPGWLAALVGVGLLTVDILIPVPSSFIMVANGALFGVALGSLLSVLGSLGAAILGFAVGRMGGPLVERLVSPEEKQRADRLIRRWGMLAIVVTRPVPLLAETVAILAGASSLGWLRVIGAAIAGITPPAVLYAATGAYAADFQSASLMFLLVLLMTGLVWLVGQRLGGDHERSEQE